MKLIIFSSLIITFCVNTENLIFDRLYPESPAETLIKSTASLLQNLEDVSVCNNSCNIFVDKIFNKAITLHLDIEKFNAKCSGLLEEDLDYLKNFITHIKNLFDYQTSSCSGIKRECVKLLLDEAKNKLNLKML